MDKEKFLKKDLVPLLSNINLDTPAVFGKMNVSQMIEHLSHAFQIASGKVVFENNQSDELTERMYRFMMSDKPFKDNTPNPNLSDEPIPLRFAKIQDALRNLQDEINDFFEVFDAPDVRVINPFFGNLNKVEQVQLLHKHAFHHLRQFGVIPNRA